MINKIKKMILKNPKAFDLKKISNILLIGIIECVESGSKVVVCLDDNNNNELSSSSSSL